MLVVELHPLKYKWNIPCFTLVERMFKECKIIVEHLVN